MLMYCGYCETPAVAVVQATVPVGGCGEAPTPEWGCLYICGDRDCRDAAIFDLAAADPTPTGFEVTDLPKQLILRLLERYESCRLENTMLRRELEVIRQELHDAGDY